MGNTGVREGSTSTAELMHRFSTTSHAQCSSSLAKAGSSEGGDKVNAVVCVYVCCTYVYVCVVCACV